MRFFTRTAPTVLPCARRGGSVLPATIGAGATARSAGPSTSSRSVGSTGGERSRPSRAAKETSWEF